MGLILGCLQDGAPALEAQPNELGAHPVVFGLDEMADEEDAEGGFMLLDHVGDEEDDAAETAARERQRVIIICI